MIGVRRAGPPGGAVAVAAAVVAAATLALGVTTPPRAGAFCQAGCVGYPYTGVAAFVPRDYWWMYPGLLGALLFAALAYSLHPLVDPARRLSAALGTGAAVIGATVLALDYAVQLMVMQPALQAGETDGLSPWSQYDPHGIFIALENLGYALFGAAFVLLGVALTALPGAVSKGARATLVLGGTLILATLLGLAAWYGAGLDVRFEVAGLTMSWLVITVAGALLARTSGRVTAGRPRPGRGRPGPVAGRAGEIGR
jgi:hypothetical protein